MARPLDWTAFQSIASDNQEIVVRLSADSLTLFLFTQGLTGLYAWEGAGGDLTSAEADDIDAMLSNAYAELMTEVLTVIPVGSVFPFATTNPPPGSLECDGASYLRVDHPALYAALDAAFIVDADHFVVPDLRSRVPIGAGTGTGLSAYAVGDTGGEEAHTLVEAELASHDHAITDLGHEHSYRAPNQDGSGVASGTTNVKSRTLGVLTSRDVTGITIDAAGSDAAHENRQPYLALRYAICAL